MHSMIPHQVPSAPSRLFISARGIGILRDRMGLGPLPDVIDFPSQHKYDEVMADLRRETMRAAGDLIPIGIGGNDD